MEKRRSLDEILEELTWVTDQVAKGKDLGDWQEDLIREMNSHPDNK